MWQEAKVWEHRLTWTLVPALKAWIQRHIALPAEVPRAPRRWDGTATHHAARSTKRWAKETWQVRINPCRQTVPSFSLFTLQLLPAVQPGKADIRLVSSQLLRGQQDAKTASSRASPVGLRCFDRSRQPWCWILMVEERCCAQQDLFPLSLQRCNTSKQAKTHSRSGF